MKKIVRLTESDLVRLVKRIIKEGEESMSVEEIKHNILDEFSEKKIMTLGKIMKNLGREKFMELAIDAAEEAVGSTSIEESEKTKTAMYMAAATGEILSLISVLPVGIYSAQEDNLVPLIVEVLVYLASIGTQSLTRPKGLREPNEFQ